MPDQPKVLCFSGSLRTKSWNHKLVEVAAGAAEAAGAKVTVLRLRDYSMPIYDGDFEDKHGLPPHARALKGLFKEHHGFLIATPEYNGSISAALKNTIDWLSRREGDEPPLSAFSKKIAGLMSTSPGRLGGLRGLTPLRVILAGIGTFVLPHQVAIPGCVEAFGDDGQLADPQQQGAIELLATEVVVAAKRLLLV